MASSSISVFKAQFKRYKKRYPPPDLSEVIDFDDATNHMTNGVERFTLNDVGLETIKGLLPPSQWKCFTLSQKPGLIFIQNPFRPETQKYWMQRCICDFPFPPNVTNLDAQRGKDKDSKQYSKADLPNLRWTTLGHEYDWSNKVYSRECRSPVPSDLMTLGRYIGRVIGYPNFTPETVIVNYYHLKSTLNGHVDHSENDLSTPIITISLGQDAVFLLGGLTEQDAAVPLFLHSGDIIVLGGQSRLAYHAVPKIVKSPVAHHRWMVVEDTGDKQEALPAHVDHSRVTEGELNGEFNDRKHEREVYSCDYTVKDETSDSNFCADRDQRARDDVSDVCQRRLFNPDETESGEVYEYAEKNRINISLRQVHKR